MVLGFYWLFVVREDRDRFMKNTSQESNTWYIPQTGTKNEVTMLFALT